MYHRRTLAIGLAALAFALAFAPGAQADDQPTAPDIVPLEKPPGSGQVPVPDVRGMNATEARATLQEAGLALGGVERISKARLEQTYGQKYDFDMVVQQAPAPSAADTPSWLKRGGLVWLRIAVAPDDEMPLPPTAGTPLDSALPRRAPVAPSSITRAPGPGPRYTAPAGQVPPRPPPPSSLGGVPVTPSPRTIDYYPEVQFPRQPIGTPRLPSGTPSTAPGPAATSAKSPCGLTLSCDRNEAGWHFRAVGGAAFWSGTDAGSTGIYAGADLGYTLCNCLGIDVFYRYAGGSFDRTLPNGLLEDSGGWHTIGAKATFDKTFSKGSRWYWSAGLGAGYFQTNGYQENDDGLAGFGEFHIGYLLSNGIRARIGVNVHAMDTVTGRKTAADAQSGRLLWTIAPVLSIEFDF